MTIIKNIIRNHKLNVIFKFPLLVLGLIFSDVVFSQNAFQSIETKIIQKDNELPVEGFYVIEKKEATDSILHKRIHFSIFPSFKRHVIHDVSLNVLFSYSKGNRCIGISGIGNITDGSIRSLQVAGLFNIVKKNAYGIQMTGGLNYVKDTLKGVQLGGLCNVVNYSKGKIQMAAIANIVKKGKLNAQFSGIVGLADSITGVQVAGIFNDAKYVKGIKIAAVFNKVNSLKGLQVAGLANQANSLKGLQVAAIINIAKQVRGAQIGLINYADSIQGMQVGLINYSKHGGYNIVELSVNEINYLNIAYKSGTKKLYTAFVAGMSPYSSGNVLSYGGGIGTMVQLTKWSDLNLEALIRHVNVGESYDSNRQEWIQLGIYYAIHLSKRFEIVVGPNNNAVFFDKSDPNFENHKSKIFSSRIDAQEYGTGNLVSNLWVGGTLGLRIRI